MFDLPLDDACRPTGILFENADWRLSDDGLEHRETGYFIARDTLAMRRGELWEWPLHLAEKNWCAPRSFRDAFLAAIEVFGLTRDAELDRTFAIAFGRVAGGGKARTGKAGFVALGDLVRPKSATASRKRGPGGEQRVAARRAGVSGTRAGEHGRQRVAL